MRNDFESGYLMHWGLKKGAQKKNHKYYARIELAGGKYRYFYTQAEYNSYLKGKQKDKNKDSIADLLKKFGDATLDKANKLVQKGKKKIDDTIKKLKQKRIDKKTKDLKTDSLRDEQKRLRKESSKNYAKDLQTQRRMEKQRQKWAEQEEKAERKKRQAERIKQNAFKIFSSDAKDSKKEDQSKHPELRLKQTAMSKDQDMAAVNRDRQLADERYERLYKQWKEAEKKRDWDTMERLETAINVSANRYNQSSINCASCSIAYDMRRRGYDVTAPKQVKDGFYLQDSFDAYKPRDAEAYAKGDYEKAYDAKFYNASSRNKSTNVAKNGYHSFDSSEIADIKSDILEKYPEGAYGILQENWYTGGGHSVIWSIENGDVVIRDCQVNEIRTFEEDLSNALSCSINRIDDLELDEEAYAYANAKSVSDSQVYEEYDPRRRRG